MSLQQNFRTRIEIGNDINVNVTEYGQRRYSGQRRYFGRQMLTTENIKNIQTSECLGANGEKCQTSECLYNRIVNDTSFVRLEMPSVDHTARQMLDPIWTPKLRSARPGEYLAGGPPGKLEESTYFNVLLQLDSNIPMSVFQMTTESDCNIPMFHSYCNIPISNLAFRFVLGVQHSDVCSDRTFRVLVLLLQQSHKAKTERHSDLFDSMSWISSRQYDIPIFGFCRCIEVSEDSSADRKTKLTLMLTEPRNIPIVF